MHYNKNLQCIEKILKWIKTMRRLFSEFSIETVEDYENCETCQLAISQLVTNVYELVKKIDENFYEYIPKLMNLKRRIKLSRNIASHDYENLDLDIVYKLVLSITRTEITEELEAIINDYRIN